MSNKYHGTLYVGVTSDLLRRVFEHKKNIGSKFVTKYQCTLLVYYFFFDSIVSAIVMEKKLKKSSRQRKIVLIESINSEWKDLYPDIFHTN